MSSEPGATWIEQMVGAVAGRAFVYGLILETTHLLGVNKQQVNPIFQTRAFSDKLHLMLGLSGIWG